MYNEKLSLVHFSFFYDATKVLNMNIEHSKLQGDNYEQYERQKETEKK